MGWGGTGHSFSAGLGSWGNDTVLKGRASVCSQGICGTDREGEAWASEHAFATHCVTPTKPETGVKEIQSEQPAPCTVCPAEEEVQRERL